MPPQCLIISALTQADYSELRTQKLQKFRNLVPGSGTAGDYPPVLLTKRCCTVPARHVRGSCGATRACTPEAPNFGHYQRYLRRLYRRAGSCLIQVSEEFLRHTHRLTIFHICSDAEPALVS